MTTRGPTSVVSTSTTSIIVSAPHPCIRTAGNRYDGWHENSLSSPPTPSLATITTDAPPSLTATIVETLLVEPFAAVATSSPCRKNFANRARAAGEGINRGLTIHDQRQSIPDSWSSLKNSVERLTSTGDNFPIDFADQSVRNRFFKQSIDNLSSGKENFFKESSSNTNSSMAMLFPWTHYFAHHRLPSFDLRSTIAPSIIDDIAKDETDIWPYSNFKNLSYDETGSGEMSENEFTLAPRSFVDWTGWELNFWMHGVIMPLIALFGLFANSASFVVLTRGGMRSAVINTYLAALSAYDGLLLLNAFLLYPPMSYCEWTGSRPNSFWCRYFFHSALITYPLSLIAQSGSVWTLTAITVDRFIAITWPLASRKWCTNRRAMLITLFISLWSIIYNLPAFFELKLLDEVEFDDMDRARFVTLLDKTDLRKSASYVLAYKGYCYSIFMLLLPAGTMIALNVYMIVAVRRASNFRRRSMNVQSNQGRDDKERRCTLMAVLVVGTFLILNSLAFVNNLLEGFQSEDELATRNFLTLVCVGNVLVALNSATNFFIYCALGLRFRQMFCKLFCKICYTPEREYQYLSVYYGSGRNYCWTNGGGGSHRELVGPNESPSALLNGGIISMRTLTTNRSPRHHRHLDDRSATASLKPNISAPGRPGSFSRRNPPASRISSPVDPSGLRSMQNPHQR